MNNNPTRRRPADDDLEHRAGGGADRKGRADSQREPFSVVVYPVHGPDEGIDVTSALVDTIAMILWKLQGGNEPVNQLEATMLLERAMAGRTDASET